MIFARSRPSGAPTGAETGGAHASQIVEPHHGYAAHLRSHFHARSLSYDWIDPAAPTMSLEALHGALIHAAA